MAIYTRSLLTTKQTLTSLLSRSYTSAVVPLCTPPSSSISLLRLRPLVAANFHRLSPATTTLRGYSTQRTSTSFNDPNLDRSDLPPEDTATTRIFTGSHLTTKQNLTSLLSRSYTSPVVPLCTPPSSSISLLRLRPLVAANFHRLSPVTTTLRGYSTRRKSESVDPQTVRWSNLPPEDAILLGGCDLEHWFVVMEKPEGNPTRDEIIDSYIKTLAQIVGRDYMVLFMHIILYSEEEAKMKIYSVSTRHYFAFGANISEKMSGMLKEVPNVLWVLPDAYLDHRNKDYGGEPFINGKAVPYDTKYHAEWVRNAKDELPNMESPEIEEDRDAPPNMERPQIKKGRKSTTRKGIKEVNGKKTQTRLKTNVERDVPPPPNSQ